jgi:Uma2 family endonuclease
VLSPSTEHYDRTTKFDLYRKIPSLREYVLVSQNEPRIEVFSRRDDGGWSIDVAATLTAVARISSIGIELPLSEAFDGVEFPSTEAPAQPS